MKTVEKVAEDALIDQIGALFDQIRFTQFPKLEVERVVVDDRETFMALRCPRCKSIVSDDDLYVVDFAERWSSSNDIAADSTFDRQEIQFSNDESGDFGDTVYYRHDDHAVSLPDGWTESWL